MKSRRAAGTGGIEAVVVSAVSDTALAEVKVHHKLTRLVRLPARGTQFDVRYDMPSAVRTAAAIVAMLLSLGGCKAVTLAYGPDVVTARAYADGFASAIEQRFTRVYRSPTYNRARIRIARYALAPSKLIEDTTIWTGSRTTPNGAERDLELSSGLNNGQYAFVERAQAPSPTRTGDARHFIQLRQLDAHDDWMWTTQVDHAVGTMPPARATDVFRALFASAERPSAVVRADYRATFPRTSIAMGRLFAIDSINTATQSDGSTVVALHILVDNTGLKAGFPGFAKFAAKYIESSRYRYRLSDRAGSDWFDAQQANKRLIIRFRSRNGELQPLLGAARRMPDSLLITVDALAKLGMFTVGVTNMSGEFVHVQTATERGWALRFTKEPEWHLPLFSERMLKTPLHRPFEGPGLLFKIGLKSNREGQTMIARRFDVAIRESAIVRFLGNLGFGAMNDYAGPAELEEHRFVAEAFAAMRADIAAARP